MLLFRFPPSISSLSVLKLALFITLCGQVNTDASTFTTVVPPGTPVPSNEDFQFTRLASPSINSAGVITFTGHFADGVGEEEGSGVWVATNASLRNIVMSGSQAPEVASGLIFSAFSHAITANTGRTAVVGSVTGMVDTVLNRNGVWAKNDGDIELVVGNDNGGPIGPQNKTISFSPRSSAFSSDFVGLANNGDAFLVIGRSVYKQQQGQLPEEIALSAFPSTYPSDPSFVADSFFASGGFNDFDPRLNISPSGQIAFSGSVRYLNANSQSRFVSGIWGGTFDSVKPIAVASQTAPGLPQDLTFTSFRSPNSNDMGHVAFVAELDATSHSDRGVWVGNSAESLRLVAREGINSFPSEFTFRDFLPPVVNAAGRTAFMASVGLESGIWSEGFGDLEMIALEGHQAPGLPDGVVFGRFFGTSNANPSISSSNRLVLNGRGQVAFTAELSQRFVSGVRSIGIFAQDLQGVVSPIARTGQTIDLGDGVERTISHLDFQGYSGNEDGRTSGFSDDGRLVFAAQFTDGTAAVIISNAVAVPEPSPLVLAMLGCSIIVMARKSQLHDRRLTS